jgi:cytochrome c-type biogenesis protein
VSNLSTAAAADVASVLTSTLTSGVSASVGSSFQHTVLSGSLLLALPVAAIAGLVSFLSPCVVPLVPGYLSYVTGLTGADLDDSGRHHRGRVLAGSLLFVLGFSFVFVSYGALLGGVGATLRAHTDVLDRILGVLMIGLGLAFVGLIPGLQREARFHHLPAAGIAGAPFLGFLFGVGWTPCIGPTLGAVQTLALAGSSATQGALLSFAYCLGLGIPFVLVALAFRRALGALTAVKRHFALVTRVGGAMLVVVGILLLTGTWQTLVGHLQTYVNSFVPAV